MAREPKRRGADPRWKAYDGCRYLDVGRLRYTIHYASRTGYVVERSKGVEQRYDKRFSFDEAVEAVESMVNEDVWEALYYATLYGLITTSDIGASIEGDNTCRR